MVLPAREATNRVHRAMLDALRSRIDSFGLRQPQKIRFATIEPMLNATRQDAGARVSSGIQKGMAAIILLFLTVVPLAAQSGSSDKNPLAGQKVVADLDTRLARFKRIKMPFHQQGLSAREIKMVDKLVQAANCIEQIYWRQSDPDGLKLYVSLAGSTKPEDLKLRRFLKINGSHYDLVDEMKPFVGTAAAPPGRALYPAGLTSQEIEKYVQQHPDQKAALYGDFTVVRRKGDALMAIPYHVEFAEFVRPAAQALREAATLSDDPGFAKFLWLRADALLNDDYYQSDLAWLDLQNPKFDLILAPYKSYLDNLLGVKASYGASVLVRNEEESKKLDIFQKYVPDLQESLPLDKADLPSKRGHLTPMEVMDAPFRTGDLLHGYQAVADNLPNDARIHAEKGSKKIFFKNFMDARVNAVILPLAGRLMDPVLTKDISGDGYLTGTILHEVSHGLGPAYAHVNGKQVDIREAIGPAFGGLEEAKADVTGIFLAKWLVDHKFMPESELRIVYGSYVAGLFRTLRFGTGEAHGRAEMM